MTAEKQNEMNAWLDSRISDCGRRMKALLADDRADEANFEKIRANVYDIFRTILSVAVRTCKEEGIEVFFMSKLQQLPKSWEASYELAENHGDVEKMEIERIKLDAVREIREKFAGEGSR